MTGGVYFSRRMQMLLANNCITYKSYLTHAIITYSNDKTLEINLHKNHPKPVDIYSSL